MNAKKILLKKGINPNKPILQINRGEALISIMATIKEYCPNVKIEKMSKNDLERLIDGLGEDIIKYHPEDYHQERSTLLGCSDMLRDCCQTPILGIFQNNNSLFKPKYFSELVILTVRQQSR